MTYDKNSEAGLQMLQILILQNHSVPSSNAQTLVPLSSDLHQGHRVYIRERIDGCSENEGIFKYFGITEAEYEP